MWKTKQRGERTLAKDAELADRARFSTVVALVVGMAAAPAFVLVFCSEEHCANPKDVAIWLPIPAASCAVAAYLCYRLLGWASLAAGIVNGWGITAAWTGIVIGGQYAIVFSAAAVLAFVGAGGFLKGGLGRRRRRHRVQQAEAFE